MTTQQYKGKRVHVPTVKNRRRKPPEPEPATDKGNSGGGKKSGLAEKAGYAYDPESGQWQHKLGPYMTIIHFLGILVLLIVCIWNVGPYEAVVRVVGERFTNSSFIELINKLPVISWIVRFLGNTLVWLIAFAIWAFFQTIELLPIIMKNDRKFVRSILYLQDKHQKFHVNQADAPVVKGLKRYYNLLPIQMYSGARRMATVVYIIDFFVCSFAYPPAPRGAMQFLFYLATAQWNKIDWLNVILLFSTLFAVEAMVKLLIWINKFRSFSKQEKETPAHA